MNFPHGGLLNGMADYRYIFVQMSRCSNGICMASLHCGHLHCIPDHFPKQMLSDIDYVVGFCMTFVLCGFLYGVPKQPSVQRLSDINCTCMALLLCGFSYGKQ